MISISASWLISLYCDLILTSFFKGDIHFYFLILLLYSIISRITAGVVYSLVFVIVVVEIVVRVLFASIIVVLQTTSVLRVNYSRFTHNFLIYVCVRIVSLYILFYISIFYIFCTFLLLSSISLINHIFQLCRKTHRK